MLVPQAKKCLARRGVKAQSPAYMASALNTELLTTPAEMNAGTLRLHTPCLLQDSPKW